MYVLPAFWVAGSGNIRMRQFIHQDQRRFSRQRSLEIKLLQLVTAIVDLAQRQRFQPYEQGLGFLAAVGLDHPDQHVDAEFLLSACCAQHGVGLAHAG